LARFHDAFVLFDGRSLHRKLLFRDGDLFYQRLVARQIDTGVVQECLISKKLAFVLGELGLIGPGSDFDQQIPCMDHVPFLVVDFHQLAVHSASYRHGLGRCHRAKPLK
jgi:hypothetical protein